MLEDPPGCVKDKPPGWPRAERYATARWNGRPRQCWSPSPGAVGSTRSPATTPNLPSHRGPGHDRALRGWWVTVRDCCGSGVAVEYEALDRDVRIDVVGAQERHHDTAGDFFDAPDKIASHRLLEGETDTEDQFPLVVPHEAALALGQGVLQHNGHEVIVQVAAGLRRPSSRVLADQLDHEVGDRQPRMLMQRRVLDAGHRSSPSRPPLTRGTAQEGRRRIRSVRATRAPQLVWAAKTDPAGARVHQRYSPLQIGLLRTSLMRLPTSPRLASRAASREPWGRRLLLQSPGSKSLGHV